MCFICIMLPCVLLYNIYNTGSVYIIYMCVTVYMSTSYMKSTGSLHEVYSTLQIDMITHVDNTSKIHQIHMKVTAKVHQTDITLRQHNLASMSPYNQELTFGHYLLPNLTEVATGSVSLIP